jgi:hypothetical protein
MLWAVLLEKDMRYELRRSVNIGGIAVLGNKMKTLHIPIVWRFVILMAQKLPKTYSMQGT